MSSVHYTTDEEEEEEETLPSIFPAELVDATRDAERVRLEVELQLAQAPEAIVLVDEEKAENATQRSRRWLLIMFVACSAAVAVCVAVALSVNGSNVGRDKTPLPSKMSQAPPAIAPPPSPQPSAAMTTPFWSQLGETINGVEPHDSFGFSISLSSRLNSTTIAAGAPFSDPNGSASGQVRVFQNNQDGRRWTQLGQDLNGDSLQDGFGASVSISAHGRLLAIGAVNLVLHRPGYVRYLRLEDNDTTWVRVSQDLVGDARQDYFGTSISLSNDGNLLAVGADQRDANGPGPGRVKIYRMVAGEDNNNWEPVGQELYGDTPGDAFGAAVSLSSGGDVLAVGAEQRDSDASVPSGYARVFQFDGRNWTKMGDDLVGEAAFDLFGRSVALAADGMTVAVGAPTNDGNSVNAGHVRVFHFENNQWNQLGSSIEGQEENESFGFSVDLSADGATLAAHGSPFRAGRFYDVGRVRMFRFEGDQWKLLGGEISGRENGDRFGYSVALSEDATMVAIGATHSDSQNGEDAGLVQVYHAP